MNEIDLAWLETNIFYRDLTKLEMESLHRLIQTHHFQAGEKINIETRGSEGCIYLIRSGSIKLSIELDDGSTHATDLSEGAQIGDLAFVNGQASIMIEVIEDVVAYSIYRASLANFFIFRPEVNLKELWPKTRIVPSINHSKGISFDQALPTS